jgi:hypothetical protein
MLPPYKAVRVSRTGIQPRWSAKALNQLTNHFCEHVPYSPKSKGKALKIAIGANKKEQTTEQSCLKPLFSSSPASGRPALHESLFYISVPRWIFLLTFFPGESVPVNL